ncbi:MAG: thiamine-phosphate kinase [Moorella humiferrea]|nr:thiamine-phosphate kinase [Moorella humiferrea]
MRRPFSYGNIGGEVCQKERALSLRLKDLGEFGLIQRIQEGCLVKPERVLQGIGDDAAVLHTGGDHLLLASTDMLVEGIHFTLETATPFEIGYKAVAVNISDIAAMGGIPLETLISVGLYPDQEVEFVDELYRGMKTCCRLYGVNIIGGDTVASPRAVIVNVAILGRVEAGAVLYRSTARPGDVILVTGDLGASAAGLDILLNPKPVDAEVAARLRKRHFRPTPRVEETRAAVEAGGLTAADDISDGLAREIKEIASASGVGALLYGEQIPISPDVREAAAAYGKDPLDYALFGGEDFELLWTCRPEAVEEIRRAVAARCGTPVTVIGEIVPAAEGVNLRYQGCRRPLLKGGYTHFAQP